MGVGGIVPIEHCACKRLVVAHRAKTAIADISQRIVELFMVNKFDDGKKEKVERWLKKGTGILMQANRFGMKQLLLYKLGFIVRKNKNKCESERVTFHEKPNRTGEQIKGLWISGFRFRNADWRIFHLQLF